MPQTVVIETVTRVRGGVIQTLVQSPIDLAGQTTNHALKALEKRGFRYQAQSCATLDDVIVRTYVFIR